MKRLFLLRHAKTEEINKDTPADRERALTEGGRRAASLVGRAMDAKGYLPDRILSSPSSRTRQTLELAQSEFDKPIDRDFVEELYDARVSDLLDVLRGLDDNVRKPLVIGHNPGFHQLAVALLSKDQEAGAKSQVAAMKQKFPTCALAVFDFDIGRWSELALGSGKLIDFIRPKDLA